MVEFVMREKKKYIHKFDTFKYLSLLYYCDGCFILMEKNKNPQILN